VDNNQLSNPRVNAISQKILEAARGTLGNKLERVILFGSYARGDYDHDSDIDFLILGNIPQEEAGIWRRNIRKLLPLIDLEYDIAVSLHVTSTSIFNQYIDTLPYYMNIVREGVWLYE